MNVLLVEDDDGIRSLLVLDLTSQGHQVTAVAGDFRSAMTDSMWVGQDAAVIDLMLPGVTGLEILRWAAERHAHVRRVAITASLVHAPEAEGWAHRTLIKPFPREQLQEALTA